MRLPSRHQQSGDGSSQPARVARWQAEHKEHSMGRNAGIEGDGYIVEGWGIGAREGYGYAIGVGSSN